MSKVILASSSPRRRQLLKKLKIAFDIIVPNVEEINLETANKTVSHNARIKALTISKKFPNHLIIAADTVVNLDNRILGKPNTLNEAKDMLKLLSNRWHEVLSGVCIISPHHGEKVWVSKAKVLFNKLSDEDIQRYIKLVNPLDKAGSYNIEEQELKVIKRVKGNRSTIMGLPLNEVKECLQKFNTIT